MGCGCSNPQQTNPQWFAPTEFHARKPAWLPWVIGAIFIGAFLIDWKVLAAPKKRRKR